MITLHACSACAASGTPALCAACTHNYHAIQRLNNAVRLALNGWAAVATTPSDLQAITHLRAEIETERVPWEKSP